MWCFVFFAEALICRTGTSCAVLTNDVISVTDKHHSAGNIMQMHLTVLLLMRGVHVSRCKVTETLPKYIVQ